MKKAMTYIGVTVVSLAVFFVLALTIDGVMDYLYWNTSLVDWFYNLEAYSWICMAICLTPALAVHTSLYRTCFDKK